MSDNQKHGVSIGAVVGLGVIRVLNLAFDAITLPVYYVVQAPWRKTKDLTFARPLEPTDTRSPWVRDVPLGNNVLDGVATVDELVRRAIRMFPNKQALGGREVLGEEVDRQSDGKVFKKLILGDYKWLTYTQLDEKIDLIGKGLMMNGIRPRQNVVVFAETRVEWMLSAQALLRLNVAVVTLYSTLGDEGVIHGINETESTHLITSEDLLPKIRGVLSKISSLTHIIYIENPLAKSKPEPMEGIKLIGLGELQVQGATADPELKGETPTPDDVAIIMYTSGSTGVPKGVVISHSNIVATARGFATVVAASELGGNLDDSFIAYLPLAHVLELAAESLALATCTKIGYSSPLTLTDRSTGIQKGQKGDASMLRPTLMASVPLVLDRIRKGIVDGAHSRGAFFGAFFDWAVSYKQFWTSHGFQTPILNILLFNKLKKVLGGDVQVICTGSAPLSTDTHAFIEAALCCKVMQGYGLTETTAGTCIMEPTDSSRGRVGAPLIGTSIKLVDWDEANYHTTDKPNPRGEVAVAGDTVTIGYYKNDDLTRESYREEGGVRWFYTGDIGEMFPDGTIKIIDRKKDLIKLQFGEYISLGKVESELKTAAIVDNICVCGSSFHTYLVGLVVPNQKALGQLAASMKKDSLNFEQQCRDPSIVQAALQQIINHGKNANLNKMEIPTKLKLCLEDWQPDSGLVTAAFKIRRKQIEQFYQVDIESMYGTSAGVAKSRSSS